MAGGAGGADGDSDCDGDGGSLQLEFIKYKQCFRPYC